MHAVVSFSLFFSRGCCSSWRGFIRFLGPFVMGFVNFILMVSFGWNLVHNRLGSLKGNIASLSMSFLLYVFGWSILVVWRVKVGIGVVVISASTATEVASVVIEANSFFIIKSSSSKSSLVVAGYTWVVRVVLASFGGMQNNFWFNLLLIPHSLANRSVFWSHQGFSLFPSVLQLGRCVFCTQLLSPLL